MSRLQFRKPSPALVVATVALIVAMAGTSYAAFTLPKNSVGANQLKNGAVTTKKLRNGAVTAKKLNLTGVRVPNAVHANSATNATNATNASELGGQSASAYALAGQPGFTDATLNSGVSNYGNGFTTAGYMKDTLGFVHLKGTMNCPSGEFIAFTLPAGERPPTNVAFPISVGGGATGSGAVLTDGSVDLGVSSATTCAIDGMTFKAG
jgi:hypothetical protein